MDKTTLQEKFRDEVNRNIDVVRIVGDRYVIFVPPELTGEVRSRIVLWRDVGGHWWLTDECQTFRKQSRTDTTMLHGLEIRLEVLEYVSGGDLKLFISAMEKMGAGLAEECYDSLPDEGKLGTDKI